MVDVVGFLVFDQKMQKMKSGIRMVCSLTNNSEMSTQPSTSYKMSNTENLIYNLSKSISAFEVVLHEKDKEIAQLKAYIGTMVTSKLPEPVVEKPEPVEKNKREPVQPKPAHEKYTDSDVGKIVYCPRFESECRIEKVTKFGNRIKVRNFEDLEYYWIPAPPRSGLKPKH